MLRVIKQLYRSILVIILFGCSISCASPVAEVDSTPTSPTPSPTSLPSSTPLSADAVVAYEYLETAFDIIEANALNADQVDWDALREKVFTRQQGVTDISKQHIQIKYILTELNDHHSHFLTPEEAEDVFWHASIEQAPSPWGEILSDRYAYLWMGGFASADPEVMDEYASNLQQIVKDLDAQGPCVWVLDLRDNNGGNLHPMVAGLGELIGDGLVAQGMNNQGEILYQSFYKDGGYYSEGEVIAQAEDPDFALQHKDLPISVLIGPNTMSSGEALAMAFRGKPNVTLIGHETAGLTTGKTFYELSDGALIFLTVTIDVDPTGKAYGGKIIPDILLDGSGIGASVERETIPEDVLDWLQQNVECNRESPQSNPRRG